VPLELPIEGQKKIIIKKIIIRNRYIYKHKYIDKKKQFDFCHKSLGTSGKRSGPEGSFN
jgi:hypothetical protein